MERGNHARQQKISFRQRPKTRNTHGRNVEKVHIGYMVKQISNINK